uniref:Uncharacterized protein n=1 Tax=Zea mays TaxID=4577 RepID=C4J8E9_MAIZE|nr:unknown [Zea mays]
MDVDAVIVLCAFPRVITTTVTSSWYFLLLPTGILINSSAVKAASLAALSISCSIRYFAGSPIGLSCIN